MLFTPLCMKKKFGQTGYNDHSYYAQYANGYQPSFVSCGKKRSYGVFYVYLPIFQTENSSSRQKRPFLLLFRSYFLLPLFNDILSKQSLPFFQYR